MSESRGLSDEKLGLLGLLKHQAMKLMPYIFAAGSGKYEVDLLKLQATPLLTTTITAKIETPLPRMLLAAFMRRYRERKTRDAIQLRNEGEVKDDWILVESGFDFKKEYEHFLELTRKFEDVLKEDEKDLGGNIDELQIIEHYVDLMDKMEEAVGADQAVEAAKNTEIILISEREGEVLPVNSTEVTDLNLQDGMSTPAEEIETGATLILSQQKEMDNFAKEKVKFLKDLEERKVELRRQHLVPAKSPEEEDSSYSSFAAPKGCNRKGTEVHDLNLQLEVIAPAKKIEKGATLTLSQKKEMDNFAEERKKLLKELEERKAELKRQQYEEDVKLGKEFDEELARLVEKYRRTS